VKRALQVLRPDPKRFTVLMYHRPTGHRDAGKAGVDLMLSGHTHGGQFFPFVLFAKMVWGRRYGLFHNGGMYHYVTSGTGTWGPPLRFGTSSEIALFEVGGKT
jgi:predicted MPP superfamily phosphohydrolase